MKFHIENLHITLGSSQQPAGLLASLAIAGAATQPGMAPAIGERWPGLEAIYAGTALSQDEDRIVHLILWLDDPKKSMDYADAVAYSEQVNPQMGSHLPTRHQSITLFERLQDQFEQDYWHWTLTKTKSGKAAFHQYFSYGYQGDNYLSAEVRVRAVSEIQL